MDGKIKEITLVLVLLFGVFPFVDGIFAIAAGVASDDRVQVYNSRGTYSLLLPQ